MKKIIFLAATALFITAMASAQILRPAGTVKKMDPARSAPPPTPPPPPPSPVYSLSSIKVSIKTGSDNKEFPSGVYVEIWQKGHTAWDYQKYCYFKITDLRNEMAVNSTTEFGLEKYNSPADKFLLSNIQQHGLEMRVSYLPNFFMDAWKVDNIMFILEFRDQNGNLHPTMGTKIVSFSNASGFLNSEYHTFKCITDQALNPLTASIEK